MHYWMITIPPSIVMFAWTYEEAVQMAQKYKNGREPIIEEIK